MKKGVKLMEQLKDNRTFEHIFEIISSHGDAVASEYLEDGKLQKVTYSEFAERARQTACTLQKIIGDDKKGSFVGMHFYNCPDWPVIFWGILMAGYNAIFLDFRASQENLDSLLLDSGAVAMITDDGATEMDIAVIKRTELMDQLETPGDEWKPQWGEYLAFCTADTTAESRVFVYDGNAIASNIYGSRLTFKASPYLMHDGDIRMLAFLPFHHVFGFIALYCLYAVCAKTFIYLADRTPMTLLKTCQDLRVTHLCSVPLMWNNVLSQVLAQVKKSSLARRAAFKVMINFSINLQRLFPAWGQRFAYRKLFKGVNKKLLGLNIHSMSWGGAYLAPKNVKLLSGLGFPLGCGYGMTEAGIISAESGENRRRRWNGSMGMPFEEVKLMTPDNKESKTNSGELFIRGDIIHMGRMKEGKMLPPLREEDGWFKTGDIVRIDKNGFLFFLGMSKDTIIGSTGENIYPDEVEGYFSNIPGIQELCVLGINDSGGGGKIVLLIGAARSAANPEGYKKLSEEIKAVNESLPGFKSVTEVYVSKKPLPISANMKTLRQEIKIEMEKGTWPLFSLDEAAKSAAADGVGSQEQGADSEIKEAVRVIFSEVLDLDPGEIGDKDHFKNKLGGDSLDAITIASELEKKYDIFIPDSVLLTCTNVEDVAGEVARQLLTGKHQVAQQITPKEMKELVQIVDFKETPEYKFFNALLQQAPYNPYFIKHDSIVNDTSIVDGREIMNFASYNYLGLSGHPDTIKAGLDALEKYGSSASGSRLLTGEKTLYRELEEEIAKWKNTDDAVVLVSGHATNVTFVGNFCGEKDLIVYDALSHNSIEQGCRLSKSPSKAFPHNDYEACENILKTQRKFYEKVLVIVEGVYSMDGDIAPIPEFVRIKKKYGAFLMVDEAHSVGVIGETGKGVDEYFSLKPDDIDIKMGTLSKGLGSCGGYIAGKKELVEYLHYNLPGFVFSVGITPSSAAVALESIRIIQRDHSMIKKLQKNIKIFVSLAQKHGFNIALAGKTSIIPILVGNEFDAFNICKRLQEMGVFVVPAIYPAVPMGQARLRFCVTSDHTEEQIVHALDSLKELSKEIPMAKK
ncbi:MAG: aminotransferase class I/II-fold pyridoxal phosphate-dependent enzyme [Deltaproteobacteria bacterium]|nr:aminotransferase class I/II-fold pyridoxal phosphate-dependent enzyme [Deltaproteobacteria bacterium]